MNFVVDASIAIVWFLPDEDSVAADNALRQLNTGGGLVPDLFWHEMRNVLLTAFRRQRLPRQDVNLSMYRLEQLKIVTSRDANSSLIVELAERYSLTAYDAAYLTLAIENSLPLATLDKKLIAAAAREGVALIS